MRINHRRTRSIDVDMLLEERNSKAEVSKAADGVNFFWHKVRILWQRSGPAEGLKGEK